MTGASPASRWRASGGRWSCCRGWGRSTYLLRSRCRRSSNATGLACRYEDIHHALAFATLVVGESSTMASEAACLGTFAGFVSKSGRGVNDEQEARYGLVRNFNGGREAEALAWLERLAAGDPAALKACARERQRRMLEDVVDVTGFLVDYVERENPPPAWALPAAGR